MNDVELLRYSRQIMLPDIDVAGQEKLLNARVAIIGLGGLGSPVSMYLAAAGVGRLVLVDDDVVDQSNLQRQIVHRESSIGTSKVESAHMTLGEINSVTKIETINRRLAPEELLQLTASVDLVVDASDNFQTRYAINDACLASQTTLVSGAAIRSEGQVAVFDAKVPGSPCYRCLFDDGSDEDLNCAENGVIAPLVGIIGTIQAMEAVKLIAGFGESLIGHVLYVDAKRMDLRKFKLPKNPRCRSCGTLQTKTVDPSESQERSRQSNRSTNPIH